MSYLKSRFHNKSKMLNEAEEYKNSVIEIFNKLVMDEVTASGIYIKMSGLASHPKLVDELLEHADEEYAHFKKLISYAAAHGFVNDVELKFDENILDVPIDDSGILQLTQNLETIAIEDYKRLALMAREADDVETEELAIELMKEEMEHFDDLAHINGGVRELGESEESEKQVENPKSKRLKFSEILNENLSNS